MLQVTTQCQYFAPAEYPNIYLVGMGLSKIGNTSLKYQMSMFAPKDPNEAIEANMTHGYYTQDLPTKLAAKFEADACCIGESVHVFVDPKNNNKPAPIPDSWRPVLSKLIIK